MLFYLCKIIVTFYFNLLILFILLYFFYNLPQLAQTMLQTFIILLNNYFNNRIIEVLQHSFELAEVSNKI